MIDYVLVLELLREAIDTENWEKIEEAIQIITSDRDNPFDEYRNDEDLEEEDFEEILEEKNIDIKQKKATKNKKKVDWKLFHQQKNETLVRNKLLAENLFKYDKK